MSYFEDDVGVVQWGRDRAFYILCRGFSSWLVRPAMYNALLVLPLKPGPILKHFA